MKAVLNRVATSRAEDDNEVLESGDLLINRAEHEVRLRGAPLRLAPKEFDLLSEFVRSRGLALSRDLLLERVWGDDHFDTHTIDVHVRWLREKIEDDPGKPQRLLTVRGVGYSSQGKRRFALAVMPVGEADRAPRLRPSPCSGYNTGLCSSGD